MTEDEVFANGPDNQTVTDLKLGSTDFASPDYKPASGSPLLTGGGAPTDSFFTPTTFVGAMDGTTDWTAGWTSHALN